MWGNAESILLKELMNARRTIITTIIITNIC